MLIFVIGITVLLWYMLIPDFNESSNHTSPINVTHKHFDLKKEGILRLENSNGTILNKNKVALYLIERW